MALLQQLSALEFAERDSGTVAIAVPDRAGHDDVAMALMLAASALPDSKRLPSLPGPADMTSAPRWHGGADLTRPAAIEVGGNRPFAV